MSNTIKIDATEKGCLSKNWYYVDNDLVLVKSNTYNCTEPISEVLTSNLSNVLELEHVSYRLGLTKDFSDCVVSPDNYKYVSLCSRYAIPEGYESCSIYDLLLERKRIEGLDGRHIKQSDEEDLLISFSEELKSKLFKLIQFDAIICNVDRHLENLEFFVNKSRNLILAPIFDNGMSLYHNDNVDCSYSMDMARTFRPTHKSQIKYISSFGYSNNFGDIEEIYRKWKDCSEEILHRVNPIKRKIIEDMVIRRLDLYANI